MSPKQARPAENADDLQVADFISEPELPRLFRYRRSKRAGRAMPSRADIDPVDIIP